MTTQSHITKGSRATAHYVKDRVLRVIYHQTEVVYANLDTGEVILNTGGWRSATTKTRMNQASNQYDLGYSVYQKAHDWFVEIRATGEVLEFNDSRINFNAKRKAA